MLQVGIQLYSVRNRMAKDWQGTLRAVADAGYRVIEPANHFYPQDDGIGFGVPARVMKAMLDDLGLSVCNTHVYPLDNGTDHIDNLPRALEYQLAVGSRRITVAGMHFFGVDDVLRKAEIWNRMGEICRRYGVAFMLHNHYQEFQIFPGQTKTVMDLLLENTDPKAVRFELDTYWAVRGAQDIPALFRHMGSRILMIHQKDFPPECGEELDLVTPAMEAGAIIDEPYYDRTHTPGSFTEIGSGCLPIQSYIDAANAYTAADHIILEQDFTAMDEIESIRKSMAGFKQFTGVRW